MGRLMAVSIIAGFGLFCAVLLAVVLSGSTFGQRCSRAGYVGAAHERCVMRLNSDGALYEENQPSAGAKSDGK